MEKNLKKPLVYFDGTVLNEKVADKEVPFLISNVLAKAMFDVSTSAGLSPDEKYQAFKISQRVAADPEHVKLESPDIVLIRKVIAPVFSAGVYGQIIDLLERS